MLVYGVYWYERIRLRSWKDGGHGSALRRTVSLLWVSRAVFDEAGHPADGSFMFR